MRNFRLSLHGYFKRRSQPQWRTDFLLVRIRLCQFFGYCFVAAINRRRLFDLRRSEANFRLASQYDLLLSHRRGKSVWQSLRRYIILQTSNTPPLTYLPPTAETTAAS